MTIDAARAFCVWLEAKTGIAARLPTPEEWTALALAGSEPPYAIDEASENLDTAAWHAGTSGGKPRAVGTLAPNAAGLFDVHGNVAEWVETDQRRPIAMGGSFRDSPEVCAADARQQQDRTWNQSDPQVPKSRWWLADCSWVGFRIVAERLPDGAPGAVGEEDGHGE
jgi:formylglycine-generating enzyme required for sulfatase activity